MKEKTCLMLRVFTPASILRLSMAVLFIFAGVMKFMMGFQGIADMTADSYSTTFLPTELVRWFMYAIPFIELGLGLWLLSGFKKRCALASTGLLLIVLTFGLLVKQDPNVSPMYIYLLVTAVAMGMESEK